MSIARSVVAVAATIFLSAPATSAQEPTRRPPSTLNELSESFEALAARVSPAVVQIFTTALGPVAAGPSRTDARVGERQRGGSGVIVTADGYIITNAHVVEGASHVQVLLAEPAVPDQPGRSIVRPVGKRVEGTVVGFDRETDLAVVKIQETELTHLALGDSDELKPGQIVLAFGSPLGLQTAVSMGVVSAVGRQLVPEHPMVYIQTDAPINPGNSGGPLVNTKGTVVGINTFILSQSGGNEGIGFAAPSNIARTVYEQIREHGRMRRGIIGVNAQTITPTLAHGLKLVQTWGVVLSDVYPRSPAAGAGLQIGDIVVSLDGKPMENGRQFDVNVYLRPIGSTVSLEMRRGIRRFMVQVPVVEREQDPDRLADIVSPDRNLVRTLGILAVEIDDVIARMMPWLRQKSGVVVAAWAADAPYVQTELAPGDAIYAVNGTPVATLSELTAALNGLRSGEAVVLQIDRLGRLMYVSFEIG